MALPPNVPHHSEAFDGLKPGVGINHVMLPRDQGCVICSLTFRRIHVHTTTLDVFKALLWHAQIVGEGPAHMWEPPHHHLQQWPLMPRPPQLRIWCISILFFKCVIFHFIVPKAFLIKRYSPLPRAKTIVQCPNLSSGHQPQARVYSEDEGL